MDKVEHFEIPADDRKRAMSFYTKLFKWEPNPVPGVEDYTRLLTIRTGEIVAPQQRPFEVNGAIVKRSSAVDTPVVSVSVADIDDTLRRIEQEGGKILAGKTEFGNRCYTAYFRDTEGNTIGLWQFRTKA